MKRKKISSTTKLQVVLESVEGKESMANISRKYDISPVLINRWKEKLMDSADDVFSRKVDKEKDQKIKHYEHVIAKLTTQNDFLEKVLTVLR